MKNLKPVPADKKKSLGKLPTDVRNKMGYAQKGKMMSNRDKRQEEITKKQNPKSEYKKDKFGKTKLSYTEAKKGKMITGKKEEDDVSKYLKSIKLPDAKDVRDVVNKKAKGGEMKKPMKAALGALALGVAGAKAAKKLMKKKEASAISPAMNYLGDTAKKSMGGEMKQGYGAARTSGMGLQDEDLIPGKSMDYYKDLM
jgi:hypothetical protein